MSDVYGLLPDVGFNGKPATVSKDDFDTAFKAIYGDSIGSNPDGSIPASTSIGQEIALLTDSESSAWQVLGAIVAAFDPNSAVTPQLQKLCALTGTRQRAATHSVVTAACFGTIGTQLPPGRVLTVADTNTRWDSQAKLPVEDPHAPDSTLQAVATSWATATTYAVGDVVNATTRIWECTLAGISKASGAGPIASTGNYNSSTRIFTEDTGVKWFNVCALGSGVSLVVFESEDTGAIDAASGTLTGIASPVAGWDGAFNALSATLGVSLESEPALRMRRLQELQGSGGGPANAIRAAILRLPTAEFPILGSITACEVFVNSTNAVVDGIPAHGVEVLILDTLDDPDEDQILADAVWAAVGAGTATGGTTTKTVIDSSGNPQTVSFTRPEEVPIYVAAVVRYDSTVWTSSGAVVDAAKAAIINFGLSYVIGTDARSSPISAAIETGPYAVDSAGVAIVPAPAGSPSLPGVVEVRNGADADGTLPYIGDAMTPVTSTAVTITKRQIATIPADGSTLDITASSEAP